MIETYLPINHSMRFTCRRSYNDLHHINISVTSVLCYKISALNFCRQFTHLASVSLPKLFYATAQVSPFLYLLTFLMSFTSLFLKLPDLSLGFDFWWYHSLVAILCNSSSVSIFIPTNISHELYLTFFVS